jgi:hypothetical protein
VSPSRRTCPTAPPGPGELAATVSLLAPLTYLLVAGAGCPALFEADTHRAPKIKQAVVGRDGGRTVNAADTVVNAYAALSENVAVGATAVTVASLADLSANFSAGVDAVAWALDPGYTNNPVAANTRTNSQRGGRGGCPYSAADAVATRGAFSNTSPTDSPWRDVPGSQTDQS